MVSLINIFEKHGAQIQQIVRQQWHEQFNEQVEIDEQKLGDVIALVEVALYEEDQQMKRKVYQQFHEKYDYFQETLRYIQLVEEAVMDIFLQSNTHSTEEISIFLRESYKKLHEFERSVITEYERNMAYTVNMQKIALKELSTPIIPVLEKISILPLVGTIDATRAKLIIENVLEGVRQYRSEVLLVDITGVPVVDNIVAQYIMQAVKAVNLLGAQCIIVGIRPDMAHTIVSLGVEMNHLLTANTLQRGFAEALKLTNRKIDEV